MGNPQLQRISPEGIQSDNPPSPKLVILDNKKMSLTKTGSGSPKSLKSTDENPKLDGTSSSPSKTGRSPSSPKSQNTSPTKSLSITERLAQSTRGKSSSPKSPVTKSPPASPNTLISSKVDISKDASEQNSQSEQTSDDRKDKLSNVSGESNLEHEQFAKKQNEYVTEISSNELKDRLASGDQVSENNEESDVHTKNETVKTISDEPTKSQRIDDSIIMELKTKKEIRQKVWEFLEENSLVVFPKPCFNRIPNFKGCINATQLLEKLEDFKKAKTIQVTPDKAQETARFLTLSWGKRLLVPLLRLKEGLLQCVSLPFAEPSAKMLRSASTQKGLRKWGNKLITLDQKSEDVPHIDMIILGSVAVDKKGRRIGIGNGFCDLEFVI